MKVWLVILLVVTMLLPAFAVQASESDVFKVAFLQADSKSDNGWNAAHSRGIEMIKELGEVFDETDLDFKVRLPDGKVVQVVTIEGCGYDDAGITRKAESAIKAGADMVFGTWFDAAKPLEFLAVQYPDVLFEHGSGYPMVKNNGKNFSTYFIRQEEGDYAAGVCAARMGISEVGITGTFPIPELARAINGFILGMQTKNSKATARVVWVNSWLDAEKERMAAEGLIAEGYNAIRQLGDTSYASQAACEYPNGVAFGYGTDVLPSAPCAAVTNEWNWGDYYKQRVLEAVEGTWRPQDWWGGFAENAIRMVGPCVPLIQDVVDALTNKTLNPWCNLEGQVQVNGVLQPIKVEGCLTDMDQLTWPWYVNGYLGEYPDNTELPVY